jgi:hypothetical protein
MVQRPVPGYQLPYSVLLTRTNSGIRTRTLARIEKGLISAEVLVFHTELTEREAFHAIFLFRHSLGGLNSADVANLDEAVGNARESAQEVIAVLRKVPSRHHGEFMTVERVNPFGDLGDFSAAPVD